MATDSMHTSLRRYVSVGTHLWCSEGFHIQLMYHKFWYGTFNFVCRCSETFEITIHRFFNMCYIVFHQTFTQTMHPNRVMSTLLAVILGARFDFTYFIPEATFPSCIRTPCMFGVFINTFCGTPESDMFVELLLALRILIM